MSKKGCNPREAYKLVLKQEKERPGPYTLVGCTLISDTSKLKTRPNPMDAPLHESVFEAYKEFREIFPEGRYAMVLGAKFDPEKWDPKEAVFLDTQLVEKAMKSHDYER
jgi:hypothetical protein